MLRKRVVPDLPAPIMNTGWLAITLALSDNGYLSNKKWEKEKRRGNHPLK